MSDYFIVEQGSHWAYTYCENLEAAQRKLVALQSEQPGRFTDAELVPADDWVARSENRYLDQPIQEITEETFHEMLEVLPPLAWHTDSHIERFNMSEFTSGRITTQFARIGDKYFSKYVRHGDTSTYIKG